jgi:hypothetical protein
MGHGQMVDIVERGPDLWELVFSEAGKADYPAPPLAEIKVEAIDTDGAIHPLTVSASGRRSSVLATGRVDTAYRARVMVMHGDHFHTRESLLPGKSEIAPRTGSNGGTLVRFDALVVEAQLVSPDTFTLHFASSQGAPAAVPTPDAVVMQAIGPKAEDFQIRNLTARAGDKPGSILASGKIKDATHLRLTLRNARGVEVRSVPIVR